MIRMSRNFYCLKTIGKGRINGMEVIITPDLYPMTNNRDERNEIRSLLTELKEMLDQTSRQAQLERKANEGENLMKTLGNVPMTIYIG